MPKARFNYLEDRFEVAGGVWSPPEVEYPQAYEAKISRSIIGGQLKKAEAFWSQNEELIDRLRVAKWMDFVKQFIHIDFPIIERIHMETTTQHLYIQEASPRVLELFEKCIAKAQEIESKRCEKADLENPDAKFVGEIGERIEQTLTMTAEISGKGNADWTLSKFEDQDGCQFTTFGSVPDDCRHNGDGIFPAIKLRFTIKDHKRFRWIKQNTINRLFVVKDKKGATQ